MERINELYTRLSELEAELATKSDELKQLKGAYDRVSTDLADTLASLGLGAVRMADGKEVSVDTKYRGSIAQDRVPQVRMFLDSIGSAGILKPKAISLQNFSSEDISDLPEAIKNSIQYEIHHNTLSAFLAELASKGELTGEVAELFKVHQTNTVKLA